jgi:hypothetical protein
MKNMAEVFWNKICCIFEYFKKVEIMRTLKFKISPDTIRKANRTLIVKGVDFHVKNSYVGVITTRIILNGVEVVREISGDKIKEAYGKSLREYAEKV